MIFLPPSVDRNGLRKPHPASKELLVTQVVRWSGPPAVVRVKTAADVVVALPYELPLRQVLGLAKLVLNHHEYAELSRKISPPKSRRRH